MTAPLAILAIAAAAIAPTPPPRTDRAPVDFQIKEGLNLNAFRREGPMAAHLVLRDGSSPRLLVAFPAGDSGVGAWFVPTPSPVRWRLLGPVTPLNLVDGKGRPLHGIEADLEIDAPSLSLGRVVVGSVRTLRDFEALKTVPPEVDVEPVRSGGSVTWARGRLDGAAGYLLSIRTSPGAPEPSADALGQLVWRAAPGQPLRLHIRAATGDTPLAGLDDARILTSRAGRDPRARKSLAFLSYRQKLLAGSWRFDTYFGRDTLMSVRLLLPVLKPEEAEAGLGATLERLSPQGEVAHEECIAECAVLANLKSGRRPLDTPVLDYKMIDGNYMLAPVVEAYGERFGRERLRGFLARRDADGETFGARLVRNLRFVVTATEPFAERPDPASLLHLKPGVPVGQWRDSDTGLGGGRIPYDVNAVFAPAALQAIADLAASGALDPYRAPGDGLSAAARLADVWRRDAPAMFRTEIAAGAARDDVSRFARENGVDSAKALASLPSTAPLSFEALSLDGAGRPIPIVNSDVGFDLLFARPSPAALDEEVADVMRPFPAGLMTDVGPVVADAAYASAPVRATFGKTAYHGAVVWAWQEAVLIAGLDRQLKRTDLPAGLRARLRAARDRLWAAAQAVGETRTSELWSWAYVDGRYDVQPFGAVAADADESDAAQLWSTVFLALEATPG